MSRTTAIDIPLGGRTGRCTIEVPIAAATSTEHRNTITAITDEITAVIHRATTIPVQSPANFERLIERQGHNSSSRVQEGGPLLHSNASTVMPNGRQWVDFFMQDCIGDLRPGDRLEDLCEAWAKLRGTGRDSFNFLLDEEPIEDGSTAASARPLK
ncbi:hypothetical protein LTR10_010012 [Elasticomyces elasticus]|nr:hypothetical protein LTR10_010012 [Elasticomyces elasticus]KAK4970304.1 hypothetical protein LTR42_008471 [Elasticomyces elasticus]